MNLFDDTGTLTGEASRSAFGGAGSRREVDVTPMINIVFLLLIFFMLAGTLARPEPLSIDGARLLDAGKVLRELAADELQVSIDRAGQLAVNGELLSQPQFDEMIARFRAIGGAVEAESQTSDALARLPVSIKADAALPAERLLALMQQLRAAGLTQVTLLSVRKAGR